MKRIVALLLVVVAGAGTWVRAFQPASSAGREIVLTFDDLPGVSQIDHSSAHYRTLTDGIVGSLRAHKVPAIGFVNEGKLAVGGTVDPDRVALLQTWLDAGLELGNHTYSHVDLHRAALADVKADVVRGEAVTKALLAKQGKKPRYFRHPYLHTGRDLETKTSFERFLRERGYRVAPVTVDDYDYIFAAAFDRAAGRGDHETVEKLKTTYVEYLERVVSYYEQQSTAFVGREIPQILLLHANALNGVMIDRIARMLAARGYRFIPLDRALADPAYASPDTFVGTGGISWIHRWALTAGKRGAFFAGEPVVPEWVARQAEGPR